MHSGNQDILSKAALEISKTKDSTHSPAAYASAARLIRILRATYPEIKTETLTQNPALAEAVSKKMNIVIDKKNDVISIPSEQQVNSITTEDEKIIQDKLLAQINLNKYLNRLIEILEKEKAITDKTKLEEKNDENNNEIIINPITIALTEDEEKELNHPDIKYTFEVIKHIQQSTQNDRLLVLKQMRSLAITCPGLKWDNDHMKWSKNSVYSEVVDHATNEIKSIKEDVISSVAESLNLACRAILDSPRFFQNREFKLVSGIPNDDVIVDNNVYLYHHNGKIYYAINSVKKGIAREELTKETYPEYFETLFAILNNENSTNESLTVNAKAALLDLIDDNLNDRLISLSECCKELQTFSEEHSYDICSTGRQHALIFLLNKSYLTLPNRNDSAIQLIEDRYTFFLEKINHFIDRLIQAESEQNQAMLYVKWLSAKNEIIEEKIAPVIEFLRNKFPSTTEDLDESWKKECKQFLNDECLSFGLDPKEKDRFGFTLDKHIDRIDELPCPMASNSIMSFYQNIIKAPVIIDPSTALPDMLKLIDLRNSALARFKEQIRNQDSLQPYYESIKRFYLALKAFDNIYSNRQLTNYGKKDHEAFRESFCDLKELLTMYFTDFDLNKYPAKDFEFKIKIHSPKEFYSLLETTQLLYFQHERAFSKDLNKEAIENFFRRVADAEDNFNIDFEKLHILNIEDKTINPAILLTKEDLDNWENEFVNVDFLRVDLTSYHINRILLNALVVPYLDWIPEFCFALEHVSRWISARITTDNESARSLKKAYPDEFRNNLKFLLGLINSNLDNRIKTKIMTILAAKNKQYLISDNQFMALFSLPEESLSIDDRAKIVSSLPDTFDINFTNAKGSTLLMREATKNNSRILVELLKKNANPNLSMTKPDTHVGYTALMFAVMHGRIENIRLLLNNTALDPVKYFKGKSVFDLALEYKDGNEKNQIIEMLQNYNFLYRCNEQKETLMSKEMANSNHSRIAMLLKYVPHDHPNFQSDAIELFLKISRSFSSFNESTSNYSPPDIAHLSNAFRLQDTCKKSVLIYRIAQLLEHINTDSNTIMPIISKIKNILLVEPVKDGQLSEILMNLMRSYKRDNSINVVNSLMEITYQINPVDNVSLNEHFYLQKIYSQLRNNLTNENFEAMQVEANQIASALEEKESKIIRSHPRDSLSWCEKIIKHLAFENSQQSAKLSNIFIRYVLAFTTGTTFEEQKIIADLKYYEFLNDIRLGDYDKALQSFLNWKKLAGNTHTIPILQYININGILEVVLLMFKNQEYHQDLRDLIRDRHNRSILLSELGNVTDVSRFNEIILLIKSELLTVPLDDQKSEDQPNPINQVLSIFGNTALHIAVERKNPELVKALLAEGADPNLRNNGSDTPLTISAKFDKDGRVAKELLESKLMDATKQVLLNGMSPLDYAKKNENTELLQALKDSGFIFIKNDKHESLISLALQCKDINEFNKAIFILEHANPNHADFKASFSMLLMLLSEKLSSLTDKEKTIIQLSGISKIIVKLQIDTSVQHQLLHYASVLLINTFTKTDPNEEIKKIELLLLKEQIRNSQLAAMFSNLAFVYSPSHELSIKIALIGFASRIMRDDQIIIESCFLQSITYKLQSDNYLNSIKFEIDRISAILEKNTVISRYAKKDSLNWYKLVILPLLKDPSKEAATLCIPCIHYTLAFTPNETEIDKNLIKDLHYLLFQAYLKLEDYLYASIAFSNWVNLAENNTALPQFYQKVNGIIELALFMLKQEKNQDFNQLLTIANHYELFLNELPLLIIKNRFDDVFCLLKALDPKEHHKILGITINGIKFASLMAANGQENILRFISNDNTQKLLAFDIVATENEEKNTPETGCSLLYHAGVNGHLDTFKYLLEKNLNLYHPNPGAAQKPFVHALIEKARYNLNKLENYIEILKVVSEKFPDELDKIYNDQSPSDLLNKSENLICLSPIIAPRHIIEQQILESRIRKIVFNEEIKSLLSGISKLPPEVGFIHSEKIDVKILLNKLIENLDSLINGEKGTAMVSREFYFNEFKLFVLDCERRAQVVDAKPELIDEVQNSEDSIKATNQLIKFINSMNPQALQASVEYASAPSSKELKSAGVVTSWPTVFNHSPKPADNTSIDQNLKLNPDGSLLEF